MPSPKNIEALFIQFLVSLDLFLWRISGVRKERPRKEEATLRVWTREDIRRVTVSSSNTVFYNCTLNSFFFLIILPDYNYLHLYTNKFTPLRVEMYLYDHIITTALATTIGRLNRSVISFCRSGYRERANINKWLQCRDKDSNPSF